MANSITIEFTALPVANDNISFNALNASSVPFVRSETFKVNRVNPGETKIEASIPLQAQTFADTFILDFGSGQFFATVSGNTVTITLNPDGDFIDITDFTITGSFATAEIGDVSIVTSPYSEYAFTLDNLFYQIDGTEDATYVEFDSTVKFYKFNSAEFEIREFKDILPLFQRKGKINFGKRIHNIMSKLLELNSSFLQFRLAEFNTTLTEKKLLDNSVTFSEVVPTQLFVPGLSFQNFTLPKVLDINPHPERATINSKEKITLLLPAGTFYFAILKNGNYVSHEDMVIDQVGVYCKNVDFEDYTQGDTISFGVFNVDPSGLDAAALAYKAFRIFPMTSRFSKMLYWENDFHTTSALECTGEAFVKPEFNSIEWERVVDLVKTIEVLKINTNQILMINTGFLLKTDSNKLGSLLRSRRIWLQYNNSTIQLVNRTKSLVSSDDKTPLYSYDLEFAINKEYDEKIYNV